MNLSSEKIPYFGDFYFPAGHCDNTCTFKSLNTEISGVFLFGGGGGEIGVNKECTYPDRSQQLNIERGAERRAAC